MKWDKCRKPSEQDLSREDLLALADYLYVRCQEGWSIVSSIELACGCDYSVNGEDVHNIIDQSTKSARWLWRLV